MVHLPPDSGIAPPEPDHMTVRAWPSNSVAGQGYMRTQVPRPPVPPRRSDPYTPLPSPEERKATLLSQMEMREERWQQEFDATEARQIAAGRATTAQDARKSPREPADPLSPALADLRRRATHKNRPSRVGEGRRLAYAKVLVRQGKYMNVEEALLNIRPRHAPEPIPAPLPIGLGK